MKKNIVLLAALMMAGTFIYAQQHRTHGEKKSSGQADYLKKALALNDDQYAKIKSMDQQFGSQIKALRKDSSTADATKRASLKKLKDDQRQAIKNVLTTEQNAKWATLQNDHQQRKGEPQDTPKKQDRMKAELALNDDQVATVKAINKKFSDQMKTLRKDSTLSHDALKVQLDKLRAQQQVEMKNTLTPDQYTKWLTWQSREDRTQHHGGKHG